jgi:hypothetical protein
MELDLGLTGAGSPDAAGTGRRGVMSTAQKHQALGGLARSTCGKAINQLETLDDSEATSCSATTIYAPTGQPTAAAAGAEAAAGAVTAAYDRRCRQSCPML